MKRVGSIFETPVRVSHTMQTKRKPINFSHDVSSGRNKKTSHSHWTDCYNERARGGRSWKQKFWHFMRRTTFISQDTLLKFNERTYGPNIYNSHFSAAAVCPHCCYPHSRCLSQFFPLTLHISFLYIHRHHHHWATCWPVLISLHPKVSSVLFHGSFCFSVRSFSLRWETCYEAFCLHVVTNSLCNYVFCPNLVLYPLFIISAPSIYFIHSDVLWTGQSGDWIALGVRFFHSRPPTCTPGLSVGQGSWKVVLNTRPS